MPSDVVLIVDPQAEALVAAVRHALQGPFRVETCADFRWAKTRLLGDPPRVLATNLRLNAYNGLHLVLLASPSTRCVVYADPDDLLLAREAQRLGAFYERTANLPFMLPAFVRATLPIEDRRDVLLPDRRVAFRGGRRGPDLRRAGGA